MGTNGALRVVEEHLSRGIANIRGSRNYYRRGAKIQTVSLALLSATTTVLIGLNAINPADLLVAASLVSGGLTTVATAWSAWFGFRQLWSANTVTLASLWDLRDQIEYDKAKFDNAIPEEMVGGYHESLRNIFATHNKQWEKIRSAQPE